MHMKFTALIAALLIVSVVYSQNKRAGFSIKARLVKVQQLNVSCGVLAMAVTQQFQVIETDLPFLKRGMFVLLNMPCPEYLDKQFFIADHQYEVRACFKDKDYSNFLLFNNYKNYDLPTYWIDDIRKLSN